VVRLLAQLAQLLVQGVIAGAAAVAFIACPWLVFLPAALIDYALTERVNLHGLNIDPLVCWSLTRHSST
jgi:hypothetical protein